jgi:hypothetical protein
MAFIVYILLNIAYFLLLGFFLTTWKDFGIAVGCTVGFKFLFFLATGCLPMFQSLTAYFGGSMATPSSATMISIISKMKGGMSRLNEANLESHHPKVPHWYLFTLGTRAEARGKGFASAVVRGVLERCDQT